MLDAWDLDQGRRLAFLQIDDRTGALLRQFWQDAQPELAGIVDGFYDHLMAVPELGELIGHDPARLKAAQMRHWARLFAGRFDAAYARDVKAVGEAHHRIGLEPRWYVGAYGYLVERFSALAATLYGADPGRSAATRRAVTAAVTLDMDLVLSAHHERMDAALCAERKRAEEAARARSEFLAHMSHELRTPLNAILGFAAMLRDGMCGPLAPQQTEYAADIHYAGEHLLVLINDVLDMANVEAQRIELSEGPVDIAALVADGVQMVAAQAAAADLAVEVQLAPDLPAVRGDRLRLRQILLNVLSNAIKFTPPGGSVTVEGRLAAAGDLELSVTDTGIGMTREQVETARKPFGQVRSEVVHSHKPGTGLGIPLVEGLMRLHGGRTVIDSIPSEGTRVLLVLPPGRVLREGAATRAA